MCRIGDLQELLGIDLGRARLLVIGQFDRCTFETLTPEFFAQR